VLRVGGHLAQHATPPELLAAPADDFVRAFLGRDRGIRLLSFLPARDLLLRRDLIVPEGGRAPEGADWVVVVDEERRPIGWRAAWNGHLTGFGTYRPEHDSLRAALDAALLSPCGAAIAVDDEGRAEGVVTRDVLDVALVRAAADAYSEGGHTGEEAAREAG
jgi:osmoprotectant transport system ATP-binding protein